MSDPTVTVTLPTGLYTSLLRRAQEHQRPLEDEALVTLAAAVAAADAVPGEVAAALESLAALDNETLERISRTQPTVEDGALLSALTETRRQRALTPDEERLLAETVDRHDRVMVLRAEAVALLHVRGAPLGERVARA